MHNAAYCILTTRRQAIERSLMRSALITLVASATISLGSPLLPSLMAANVFGPEKLRVSNVALAWGLTSVKCGVRPCRCTTLRTIQTKPL